MVQEKSEVRKEQAASHKQQIDWRGTVKVKYFEVQQLTPESLRRGL